MGVGVCEIKATNVALQALYIDSCIEGKNDPAAIVRYRELSTTQSE